MTRREQAEPYALVVQAWELRDSPYLRDAVAAIVAWHERRPLTALESEQAFDAAYEALAAAYPDCYGRMEKAA